MSAASAPNALSKLVAEGPRRPGRWPDVGPSDDDERAIDRVPAYADGREKTDDNYHRFAERITKARKRTAPRQKPWKLSDSPIWRLPAQRARVGEWVDERQCPASEAIGFSTTRTR